MSRPGTTIPTTPHASFMRTVLGRKWRDVAPVYSRTTTRWVTPTGYAERVIDLHTHSSFSDGSDSPTVLAEKAHKLGISAIALTDHDTTASHDEMRTACEGLGLELVPGVELSLVDDLYSRVRDGVSSPRSVHVLAYYLPLDPESPVQKALASFREDRVNRNRQLVALLNEQGFEKLTFAYVEALAKSEDSIGRPHFAQAMFDLHPEIVGEKNDQTWGSLFVEWLGNNGKAYIPRQTMTVSAFVEIAKGTGTVFSIAHPLVNYLDNVTPEAIQTQMPKIMGSLKQRGFAGVEAYYGGTNEETRLLMVKLTREAGMIPTGGSDYHGSYKEDVQLGFGRSGDLRVPNDVLDRIKAAR